MKYSSIELFYLWNSHQIHCSFLIGLCNLLGFFFKLIIYISCLRFCISKFPELHDWVNSLVDWNKCSQKHCCFSSSQNHISSNVNHHLWFELQLNLFSIKLFGIDNVSEIFLATIFMSLFVISHSLWNKKCYFHLFLTYLSTFDCLLF